MEILARRLTALALSALDIYSAFSRYLLQIWFYSARLQKLWATFTPSFSCVENNRHQEHYKIHVEKPQIQHHRDFMVMSLMGDGLIGDPWVFFLSEAIYLLYIKYMLDKMHNMGRWKD